MGNVIGNSYVQAGAGLLRNADDSAYLNNGVTLGTSQKLLISNKDAIIGGAELTAGTALQAKAQLGYERYIGNCSGLVFTANASIDKSLTNTDKFIHSTKMNMNVDGQNTDVTGISATFWNPGQFKFNAKALFNKVTSWGGYNVGVEAGYRKSLSPDITNNFEVNSTSSVNGTIISNTQQISGGGRHAQEGLYATPTASVAVDLNKGGDWQLTGRADAYDVKVGLKYNF